MISFARATYKCLRTTDCNLVCILEQESLQHRSYLVFIVLIMYSWSW